MRYASSRARVNGVGEVDGVAIVLYDRPEKKTTKTTYLLLLVALFSSLAVS
jgi:hypothetical protein